MMALCGMVPSSRMETRCFPTGLTTSAHPYPHHRETKRNARLSITWLGLVPRTDTQQLGGIDTSRWDGQAEAGAGRGRKQAVAMSTLALQATPLRAGVRQCLLVVTRFTQGWRWGWGGRRLHGWAWKGPEDRSKGGGEGALSWLDVCGRPGCRSVRAWAVHGQVERESCRMAAGSGVRGPGKRSTINSTPLWVVFWVMLRDCGPPFLPPRQSGCRRALGLPAGLAGWNTGWWVWSSIQERSAGRAAGWGLGGSQLLGVRRLSSEPHAHGCDEGGPLAAAVFRQEEGHGTLW